ncbi:MAG: PKD domain-containing protein [Candidatus Thalassarchaeaceae archaeon]|nr:PKD domain-containing protein [Candidatus Thalassarchaeaceae archaeon]
MKRAIVRPSVLVMLLIMVVLSPGCLEVFNTNSAPTATFSVQESGTLKAGMLLHFDATGSTDAEGDSLTYSWNFGDTNTETGLTTSHTYNSAGDYTVVLSVSDGEFETKKEQELKIFAEDAAEPTASITTWKDDDCDDEPPSASGTYILVWICDDAMDESERDWDPSTTVSLDATGSGAGSAESWIVSWKWDLNINIDEDGDGDKTNDVDASGETHEWEVPPGEWKIQLTVTDDQGMTSSEDTWVYVNARAKWSDIEIARNNSAENPREDFTAPLTYDFENSHKLNQFKARLVYPKKDPGIGIDLDNRMDLYFFNQTDEEVRNSSANSDEQQTDSDCSEDNYCLTMTSSTGDFRTYLDGQWTVQVFNTKQHNAEILELQIILKYK